MPAPTEEISDVLEQLTSELPFDPTEETGDEITETAAEMLSLIDDLAEQPTRATSAGRFAEDEHNALLEVYDRPRQTMEEGQLAGLSFAVKDNIMAEGLTMTCGTKQLAAVSSHDATVVERLLADGAELVGKNNMEPFAIGPTGDHSDFGRVENPVQSGRISGGSSSGSGASVAAGTVDFALGTDTGGSVRIPAACCGVVGIKPTHGLVPRYGFVDFAPSTDTIGPIARDVSTAGRVLESMAGYDPRDPSSTSRNGKILEEELSVLDDVTVGLLPRFTDPADRDVKDAVYGVADRLDDSGDVTVTELNVDFGETDMVELYPFLATEFAWFVRQTGVIRGQGTGYSDEWRRAFDAFLETETFSDYIASRILPGEVVDALTDGHGYTVVRDAIAAFETELRRLFEDIDAFLLPTIRILPPRYDELDDVDPVYDIGGNTAPFSFAGNPAVSVPVATRSELPVSAQVVTPTFEDGLGIRIASRIESVSEYGSD